MQAICMKSAGIMELAPECFVEISSQDARKYEVEDGAVVSVASRRGTIEAKIKVSPKAVPGTVFIPFHYAAAAANRLTNAALARVLGLSSSWARWIVAEAHAAAHPEGTPKQTQNGYDKTQYGYDDHHFPHIDR